MHSDTQLFDLYRRWWTVSQSRAVATVDHYLVELGYLQQTLDGQSLLDADRLTIEAFVVDRTESSSHSGRFAYRAVRSFYAWAAERELVADNQAASIRGPKEEKNPTPSTVTPEIVDQLLDATQPGHRLAERDRAIIEILWATGVRRGELVRMELHHIDLEAATIMIPITKTKTPRVVPLTERAMTALVAWLEQRITWHPDTDHVWLAKHRGAVVPITANAVLDTLFDEPTIADMTEISAAVVDKGVAL
jgi:site-specific recombinase XerD